MVAAYNGFDSQQDAAMRDAARVYLLGRPRELWGDLWGYCKMGVRISYLLALTGDPTPASVF